MTIWLMTLTTLMTDNFDDWWIWGQKNVVNLKKQSVPIIFQIFCTQKFVHVFVTGCPGSLGWKTVQGVSKKVKNSRGLRPLEFLSLFLDTLYCFPASWTWTTSNSHMENFFVLQIWKIIGTKYYFFDLLLLCGKFLQC